MTANELKKKFDDEFGLNPRPGQFKVDHETYANVCQSYFNWIIKNKVLVWEEQDGSNKLIHVALGPNNGIMFKNIELILENHNETSI